MRRVSVVGNSGSGTSTLARRIATALWRSIGRSPDGRGRSTTYCRRYGDAMASPGHAHLRFVHLTVHDEAERWLGGLAG